jgi:hypothetical protein
VLQKNSTCSAWVDVEDLLRAQDVDAYDADGNPVHEQLLDCMDQARLAQGYLGNKIKENYFKQNKNTKFFLYGRYARRLGH